MTESFVADRGNTLQQGVQIERPVPPAVHILGVRVHKVSFKEAVCRIGEFSRSGQKHHVVTVNPEFVMEAQRNHRFREVLNGSSLAIPDGIGIVYAAAILGNPIGERVAGADLVEAISAYAARNNSGIFLLGAAEGIADRTAEILMDRYPGLQVRGTFSGSPDPGEEDDICARINSVQPDILFVAYGAPKQDLWIARNFPKLKVSVAMGVGGSFDFIAGISTRAPEWVRGIGFEWLHRLCKEPHRWRRMLALPRFAVRCIDARLFPDRRR